MPERKKSKEGRERRKTDRISIETKCWITGRTSALYTQIDNISRGGIAVSGKTPFKVGEEVSVRLMSTQKRLEVVALSRVVWAHESPSAAGMGAQFLEISSGGHILDEILKNQK